MREGICWDFPLLGTGNQSGSNIAAITMFKGAGIMDGIGRENGQNSCDAKDKELDSNIPVKIQFILKEIIKEDYPEVFEGYEEAVRNCRKFWENNPNSTQQIMDFISNVEKYLNREKIPMLVVRDFNTTGLNGVNAGPNEKSFWNLLVNMEGISIKQDKDSAGSYGIGKNAPFAYSGLNLVFYNTLAKDGGRAFEGVTRLVTSQREYNGEMRPTQPIGKFLNLKDTFTGIPILPGDDCNISRHEAFRRMDGEFGTDVGVVGFKIEEYPDWERLIAVSMIKNFIMAINDGKLVVEVISDNVEYNITPKSLKSYLFGDFENEDQLKFTRQIYETLTEPDVPPCNFTIAENNDLTIYVKYNDNYSASLSRFRSGGMLINCSPREVPPHFSVVVVANTVGDGKLSETLRCAEPPQHTEWKAKNITDNRDLHNLAARYIREIKKKVEEVINKFDETDASNVIDAGIGGYLPDASKDGCGEEGNDELKKDQKIQKITNRSGDTLYDKNIEKGESGEGTTNGGKAYKKGDRKGKKKKNKKIRTVTPPGGKTGVRKGKGKVRYSVPNITDHRTFYCGNGEYKLFIDSPKDYDKVYIYYHAGRDDDKEDDIKVKTYRFDEEKVDVSEKGYVGPISLHKGANKMFISFANLELMALIPEFIMEVGDEE